MLIDKQNTKKLTEETLQLGLEKYSHKTETDETIY